jgi:hypothetical protein
MLGLILNKAQKMSNLAELEPLSDELRAHVDQIGELHLDPIQTRALIEFISYVENYMLEAQTFRQNIKKLLSKPL